jgi:hypothetical protein
MWSNTISLYIFFKESGKISSERSHKGRRYIYIFGFLQSLFDFFQD